MMRATIERRKFIEAFENIFFSDLTRENVAAYEGEYLLLSGDFALPDWQAAGITQEDAREDFIIAVRDRMDDIISDLLYEFMECDPE